MESSAHVVEEHGHDQDQPAARLRAWPGDGWSRRRRSRLSADAKLSLDHHWLAHTCGLTGRRGLIIT
ncbi:unnamed protein product [Linum trigynum]|uniref:Uncharacterized protein n=1 Tax=Linum trigynum TaxID=586398 RepID=A0AAV2DLS4_9ROSI